MTQIALNWQSFGSVLAAEFIFGVVFACIVRLASKKQIVGQTALVVIVGVAATLLIAIPVFGLNFITFLFPCFIASGIPVTVEYILRVHDEIQQDHKKAQDIAKDLLK